MSDFDPKNVPTPPAMPRPGCATTQAMRGWTPDAEMVNLCATLRGAGLRPTQQRISLAKLLFSKGNRHVSAEILHEEAIRARVPVSLATVYNTLHQFTEGGLLREVAVDGARTYFDTNMSEHHHFFFEDENKVMDIPGDHMVLQNLPEAPDGMEISRVEVIVRVRKKKMRR